ncbi:MAG TPA: hypothetical protein VFC99_05475 [Acidimicrobiia bacterium]|nr:hypothetical protein [Acidimicrobiia bacterium]
MSELDDRLTAAFRGAAREPAGAGDVVSRVAAKRAHRRRVRQVRAGMLSVAVVVAVVAASFAIVDASGGGGSDGSHHQVAAGGPPGAPAVRVVDGDLVTGPLRDAGRAATVTAVPVPADEGYVRGPLLATGDLVAAAAYNRDGDSFTFPPSAILRFAATTGRVADRVDLQGEIEALSDGEGARFAQTRDKTVIGPQDPEFRVKRIAAGGDHVSNPIPPPNRPAGPLVAGGGAVWVPVTDGVLHFDATAGDYRGKIALAPAGHRGVAVLGKGAAYVTDGATVRRLDPGADSAPVAVTFSTTDGVGQLLDLAPLGAGGVALAREPRTGGSELVRFSVLPGRPPTAAATLALPPGVDATALHVANDVIWVEGTLDGAPVALVLDPGATRVERTVVLLDTRDESLTFTSRDTAVMTSAGAVYRISL